MKRDNPLAKSAAALARARGSLGGSLRTAAIVAAVAVVYAILAYLVVRR